MKSKVIALPTFRDREDKRLDSLLDVGAALSIEREISKILDLILDKALENTGADGGSIYLLDSLFPGKDGKVSHSSKRLLRYYRGITKSMGIELTGRHLPIDNNSIAGFVALSSQSLRLRDCYVIDKQFPFKFYAGQDKETGYRTKSVLAVPIKTSKGKVLGVLQVINKLKSGARATRDRLDEKSIIAFSSQDDKLLMAFSAQAAIALENAKLTSDIANLFESFVRASVKAIEARDPTTSGHSDRVAQLTVQLAKTVDTLSSGPYREVRFSTDQMRELRYAALLHDFGKIGVPENTLLKEKKLFPHELDRILLRLDTLKARFETHCWRALLQNAKSRKNPVEASAEVQKQIDNFNMQVEQIRRGVLLANEPQIHDKDFNIKQLLRWIENVAAAIDQKDILSTYEISALSIPRGTLNAEERKKIESHVTHTFQFLSHIAWTEDLGGVADIAHAHHEKIDGSGYPRGLHGDEIPIQSRMMAVCDIYDALTAMDRPYKKAASTERALDILTMEAQESKLDTGLVKIFVESRVYTVVHPTTPRKKTA